MWAGSAAEGETEGDKCKVGRGGLGDGLDGGLPVEVASAVGGFPINFLHQYSDRGVSLA